LKRHHPLKYLQQVEAQEALEVVVAVEEIMVAVGAAAVEEMVVAVGEMVVAVEVVVDLQMVGTVTAETTEIMEEGAVVVETSTALDIGGGKTARVVAATEATMQKVIMEEAIMEEATM